MTSIDKILNSPLLDPELRAQLEAFQRQVESEVTAVKSHIAGLQATLQSTELELQKEKFRLQETGSQLVNATSQLQTQEAELNELQIKLKQSQLKIDALTQELAYYRRLKFGSKAEQFSPEQKELLDESIDADISAIEAEKDQLEGVKPKAPRARPVGRNPFPEDLPRVDIVHDVKQCQCSTCGGKLKKIGEDISEKLHIIPATFQVQRHIRPKYACSHCESIVVAPLPAEIIDGGIPTFSLLTWIVIQKFIDHLPLYRIENISSRLGFKLPRSTLAYWIGKIGFELEPLADRLQVLLLERGILHADETPVPLLDPGAGKTKKAYLWAYRTTPFDTGPPIQLFEFQSSRSGKHARHFLQGWAGKLMVDDYAGYKRLFDDGNEIIELACMAHARRKFYDLYKVDSHPVAKQALEFFARLYAIEEEAREFNQDERLQHRATKSKPLLNEFHQWLQTQFQKAAPNGALSKALNYSLKRWDALVRYVDDGAAPIDNNPIENAIRPIAIGKKNWLFAGSERAGKRAASIQSLLATAKANGIDPNEWLEDTLARLPTQLNSAIDELLPIRGWQKLG